MSLTPTDSDGQVEWPTLPPGLRWKVKRVFDQASRSHGIKVVLQIKVWKLFWMPFKTSEVTWKDDKNIYVATGVVAKRLLGLAAVDLVAETDRRKIRGIHKQDTY